MKPSHAVSSLFVFVASVILLLVFTLVDSEIAGTSRGTQRLIALVALVVAPGFGSMLGVMSLIRKEERAWLSVTGIVLNSLFAGFHLMVILLAG